MKTDYCDTTPLVYGSSRVTLTLINYVDLQLSGEMTRAFTKLARSQVELDSESKKVLYQNRRLLYRR